MSVAVQVVNGREQGTEEEEMPEAGGGVQEAGGGVQETGGGVVEAGGEAKEEVGGAHAMETREEGGAQAMDTKEEGGAQAMETRQESGASAMETRVEEEPVPRSPKEVMSDSELDQSGAPKKKKFKAWKSIKKIFKKKKSSKGSEGDSQTPNKSKSKSTSELDMGGGELNKRISMSEDSVFTPDKTTAPKDRSSYSLNTNLADEINAKLKERASSSDDGYAQSSEDAMTTGDTTHDNSYVAPSDSSKTDSGIITTEDESQSYSKPPISNRRWKSFTSAGVKDNKHVTAEMKRLKKENPGDVDLDLIHTPKLLSSSAARHRISVAPSNRRPSRKSRSPQKRSSSRLDDTHSPIAEEPATPTKSPASLELNDSELPFPGVALSSSPAQKPSTGTTSKAKDEEKKDTPKKDELPIVIIDLPPPEDSKTTEDSTLDGVAQVEGEEEEEEPIVLPQVPKEVIIIMKDDPVKKESEEAKPTTPTTPDAPATPVELPSPVEEKEDAVPASPPPTPEIKEEVVEKESTETEKENEDVEKKKEADIEERRLSVAASKALFEAKIPEPTKSSSNKVNGTSAPKFEARRASQPESEPETKAEADTKLSEKEKVEEKKEDAEEQVFSDQDENQESQENKEEPVSLRDRISKYQNLATKTSVKGLTAHTGTRSSPTKLRPASTSNIENKDSSNKFAPKVPSKPLSTNSSKPSGSTGTTTAPSSKPSTNSPSSSSSSSTSSSTPRKPLQPKSLQPKTDRCMVCEKSVYPNEMSKFEGRVFHRACQKCSECSRTLTLWSLDIAGDRLYCKPHGTVVKNNQLKEKLIV